MTFMLEGFNTDNRYDDVRYRAYTSSKRKAAMFDKIPKIQFTDSGHGIVFHARELPPNTRRLPVISIVSTYVNEELRKIKEGQGD